jgi:hypothetical protein
MLTRNVQRVLPIPHEPEHRMTLRQLGWLALAQAEEARSTAALKNLQTMGAEMFQTLQSSRNDITDPDTAAAIATDPLLKYDRRVLLHQGIVAWTYTEPVDPLADPLDPHVDRRPVPVTDDAIDSLDPVTAEWAARIIAGLGAPPDEQATEDRFFDSPTSSTVATPSLPTNGSSA